MSHWIVALDVAMSAHDRSAAVAESDSQTTLPYYDRQKKQTMKYSKSENILAHISVPSSLKKGISSVRMCSTKPIQITHKNRRTYNSRKYITSFQCSHRLFFGLGRWSAIHYI